MNAGAMNQRPSCVAKRGSSSLRKGLVADESILRMLKMSEEHTPFSATVERVMTIAAGDIEGAILGDIQIQLAI
jgi:hypothetical protein